MDDKPAENANAQAPLGAMVNGYVMTERGWVVLGTKANGSILTPQGWIPDESQSRRLGIGIGVGAGALLISLIGLVMANASASLLTGTGTNWTGAAIAIIAVVAGVITLVLTKAPMWTLLVTAIAGGLVVILAVASVVYLEVELQKKRDDLSSIFDE